MPTNELLHATSERAARYLTEIGDRPVFPTAETINRLQELNEPLPEGPQDASEVLAKLDAVGSPATVATAGPRYFGFVIGGSLPAALAANWLAGAWDQDAGSMITSPTCARIESIVLGWLLETLRLPPGCGGAFVTGATMANFSALAAARHDVLARAGWDVEADGLFGAPPVTVVVGDEAHSSIYKALGLLGFGRERVIRVPTDGQGRMQADGLPELTTPAIVCVQAGNVNTGACDPIGEICDRAHDAGAWVHVDGAFGLWAAASPNYAHLIEDAGRADSWAIDAHKWLNVPYDSGIALVRKPDALRAAMAVTSAYLPTSDERQPDDFTPEFSRRARGVEIWAALKSLGRSGVADLIERCCRHAQRFAEGLSDAGYEVLNDVELNQMLVAFGDDETTRRVIGAIQVDGTCWCGGTVWQGRVAMRISVSSWATTEEDVERSLQAMIQAADKVRNRHTGS